MRLFCHWWQDSTESMITAMNLLLILLLALTLRTLITWVRNDDFATRPRAPWFA